MVSIADKLVGMAYSLFISGLFFGWLYLPNLVIQYEREQILIVAVLLLISGFGFAIWTVGNRK